MYSLEVTVSFEKPHNNRLAVMLQNNEATVSENLCRNFLVGISGFFGAQHHDHGGATDGHHGGHKAGGRLTKP